MTTGKLPGRVADLAIALEQGMKRIALEKLRDSGWNVASGGSNGPPAIIARFSRELDALNYRDKQAPDGIVLPPVGYPFERAPPFFPSARLRHPASCARGWNRSTPRAWVSGRRVTELRRPSR